MRNFEVVLFCAVIGCLVKLNAAWDASNWDGNAVQTETPLGHEVSTLGNTDFDPEYDDVTSSDKLNQEPSQFSSSVRREGSEIDYSECGVLKENPRFQLWPWMAALLHVKDSLYKDKIMCAGSIINKRFIMTSALCVTSFKAKAMKPEEISVVLGLAHRGGGNKSELFDVKAVHVHPGFKARSFDNDIALLELEKPIVYSFYIRPICLPTDSSKLQSLGLGLGWGITVGEAETEASLEQNRLKEVELVIQHPDACKEYLGDKQAKHFTDRMFCAVEESPYLFSGDGGGPVMQSEMREDGHRIWTEVGIISFGKRTSGPEGSIGYYSYVYKFLPWIRDITNESNE